MDELYFNSKLQIRYAGEKEINFNFVKKNHIAKFFFLLDVS